MKSITISESDVAQAVKRILADKPGPGDRDICAAWAVANFERLTRLRVEIRGLLWGAEDKTLEDLLEEGGCACQGANVCGNCGMDARGL